MKLVSDNAGQGSHWTYVSYFSETRQNGWNVLSQQHQIKSMLWSGALISVLQHYAPRENTSTNELNKNLAFKATADISHALNYDLCMFHEWSSFLQSTVVRR